MNMHKIETEVHWLHKQIYKAKGSLFPADAHPLTMLRPEIAAEVLDLSYVTIDRIRSDQYGLEVAGLLDLPDQTMYISQKFDYKIQRFTAAHECGHALMHPELAHGELMHRDFPNANMQTYKRSAREQEADYFAACYLIPEKILRQEFEARFGKPPLRLSQTVAFHLAGSSSSDLFIEPSGGLRFPMTVATKNSFNGYGFKSLADHFSVSATAMAIRLRELELVRD